MSKTDVPSEEPPVSQAPRIERPDDRDLSRTARAVRWIDGQADRPSFYLRVGVFPFLDYALPFLPNQLLLIALAFLQRTRWLGLAVTFAAASALGALAIALIVQGIGGGVANWLTANVEAAGTVFDLIETHGTWALALLAFLPTPPRTGVLLCALAGLPPLQIGGAVLAGRLVAAGAIAWIAANSPAWLRRVPGVGRRLDALEGWRSQQSR